MASARGKSIVGSLIAIVLSGSAGALASALLVGTLDWPVLATAIVGVLVAMVIAVLVFMGGVMLGKALGWIE